MVRSPGRTTNDKAQQPDVTHVWLLLFLYANPF
jgi:hypothetical protein